MAAKRRKPKSPKRRKPKAKIGRPTLFSRSVADAICDRISKGESLRQVCLDPKMPGRAAVNRWLKAPVNVEFRDQYASACESRADLMADEMLLIADDGSLDTIKRKGKDGREYDAIDHDHISRSKVMIDTRKFLMTVMAPKKYSERVVNEMTGPNGGPIRTEDVSREITDNELARRMALILTGMAGTVKPKAAA